MSMPKDPTAGTGAGCLIHALKAGASLSSSPYTDSHAIEASRLVFQHLPVACERSDDEAARSMMHKAATRY
jgi:alcohol dehydrogenase class IV